MKKRILCFLMALCLLAALLPTAVFATSGSGTLDDPWKDGGVSAYLEKTVLHVYGSGAIPSYSTTNQPWYGYSKNITSVVIESSVTGIGDNAFICCTNLTKLTLKREASAVGPISMGTNSIPVGISVVLEISGSGYMAEYDSNQPWANLKTKVTEVTVDEGVKSIGKQAFSGCTNLTSVTIPGSVEFIGQEAFASCTALTTVQLYHDFGVNGGAFTIGANAFPVANEGFKIAMEIVGSTAIPDYATVADQPWAALRTYIRTLVVCGWVPGVGKNAFSGCTGLTGVYLYFCENSLASQKVLGANWLREASTVPIAVIGTSDKAAFKTWGGGTYGSATSATTYVTYDRDGATLTAKWATMAEGIVLTPASDKTFTEQEVGYADIEPYTVTVKNSGNTASGDLLIELSSGNTGSFTLSKTRIGSLTVGASDTFTIVPKTGLAAGVYATNVAISNDDGVVASFKVSFTSSTSQTRAERYVRRLYEQGLGREADDAGLANWVGQLTSGASSAAVVAASFFASSEFRSQGVTDAQFIQRLYRAVLGREADGSGLNTFLQYLNNGKSRAWVFKQIIDSAEFQNVCNALTLTKGTIDATKYDMSNIGGTAIDKTQVTAFVERLYTKALGRASDPTGLNNWVARIVGGTSGAEVAAGFFASAEYINKNSTDTEFVTALYNTLLNRSPDSTGLSTFTGYLAAGKTRAWVFKQICDSGEFKSLCSTYGIPVGTINASSYYMGGTTAGGTSKTSAETFIKTLYLNALGRAADEAGLAVWTNLMVNKGTSGAEVAANIFASPEFLARGLNNEAYVQALYKALLNRSADATGLATFTGYLTAGKTRAWVFKQIVGSQEFKNYCATLNITPGTINEASWNMG